MAKPQTIDVHAHFLPPVYRDALRDAGLRTLDGGIPVPDWTPERALAVMDENGIAGALLSISSPHVGFADPATAVKLCRSVNDEAAALRARHPTRFGAYAILPLADVSASLAELERALDELGLDGVALPTHAEGRYLGDARLAPLLEALDEREVTVFVHPTSPPCFEAFGLELPAPMIEFPFDTTRTAASLLFSGALARHPRIRFILPHAGGTLPFLAPRIAAVGALPALGSRAVPPAEAMQAFARFHYDTALSALPAQIAALRALAPVSQILYGTDYPFVPAERVRLLESSFAALPFTDEERAQVRRGNAARLFAPFAARCTAG
ncbi:MAG TPA: amidohydrolase family protein [Myxococcota bacterium]|nr:amidohydrolase family protein [Myxococcota bacterium]